jgi:hypothetical protein
MNSEHIQELNELQKQCNDGRGISCVKSIIICMERGDIVSAKFVYSIDGDKIRQYPYVNEWLMKHFGCRIHHIVNCTNTLCITMKKYNDKNKNR